MKEYKNPINQQDSDDFKEVVWETLKIIGFVAIAWFLVHFGESMGRMQGRTEYQRSLVKRHIAEYAIDPETGKKYIKFTFK